MGASASYVYCGQCKKPVDEVETSSGEAGVLITAHCHNAVDTLLVSPKDIHEVKYTGNSFTLFKSNYFEYHRPVTCDLLRPSMEAFGRRIGNLENTIHQITADRKRG